MFAPSTSAARATPDRPPPHYWHQTALGERSGWPVALRVAADIVLDSPWPMLLLWGERQVAIFNNAYADLAGPHHARAPGGAVPALTPPPLAAAGAAFEQAVLGEPQHLQHVSLTVLRGDGPERIDCDLHLTPLADDAGRPAGVLCAIARSSDQASAAPAAGLRVLVVEDNLDSQYLVCEMLKAFGHDAHGVGHGEGALEMLAASGYDVLFSDVSLPGISGVELARQAIARTPQLRVIFASGYGDTLLRHLDFPYQSLQKPYEVEELQAALALAAAGAGRAPSV